MSQQNHNGPKAGPSAYSLGNERRQPAIKDPEPDLTPSDSQPPGVDSEPQSLEEALTG